MQISLMDLQAPKSPQQALELIKMALESKQYPEVKIKFDNKLIAPVAARKYRARIAKNNLERAPVVVITCIDIPYGTLDGTSPVEAIRSAVLSLLKELAQDAVLGHRHLMYYFAIRTDEVEALSGLPFFIRSPNDPLSFITPFPCKSIELSQ